MSLPRLAALGVALTALSLPAPAFAATSTFERLEVIGVADFRNLTETCDDGTTATSRVRITGGHEEEFEDGSPRRTVTTRASRSSPAAPDGSSR
ncbi:MAG TPA: hypothetical protein VFY58_03115 [Nocardioides sp.]|nr:hypothetical protein [Nocardioides sp.]